MYFSLILNVSYMWNHTPVIFFLSATFCCSCAYWWLLKFCACWEPSFGPTVLVRTYFAIPEGEEWCSMWQWMAVHPHWEYRSFSAAAMCWGWGTVAVWRLCMEPYPPPDGLWSMQMAQDMLRLAVSMSGAREQRKACRVCSNPYQLLHSHGTLMDDNNGFNCGLVCISGPWNCACCAEHVYKSAAFVQLKMLSPALWTTHTVLQHVFQCRGLPWAVWRWMETPSSLLSSGGSFWACWGCNTGFATHITRSLIIRQSRWTRSWSHIPVILMVVNGWFYLLPLAIFVYNSSVCSS